MLLCKDVVCDCENFAKVGLQLYWVPGVSAALLLRDDGHGDLHEHVRRVPALAQLPPAHHRRVLPVVAPVQPAAR